MRLYELVFRRHSLAHSVLLSALAWAIVFGLVDIFVNHDRTSSFKSGTNTITISLSSGFENAKPSPSILSKPNTSRDSHDNNFSKTKNGSSEIKQDINQNLGDSKSSNGAKILYQEAPPIPDRMRTQSYAASALVRFRINDDGSFLVELLNPSKDVEFNSILLRTFKKWKFAPATTNEGKPISSSVDINVELVVE